MRFVIAILAAAPLFAALPANAQIRSVAAEEINRGAYSDAEAKLQSELRIYPNRPELLLNLATVYARTGREAEARRVYAQVLDREDVLMDLADAKVAGSHLIAQAGLRKLGAPVQYTAAR